MRLPKYLIFLLKSLLTLSILYLLFTRFNVNGETNFEHLLYNQVLNPFPQNKMEEPNFVKAITVVGLGFTSFYFSIALAADLSSGAKEIIRFHSTHANQYYKQLLSIELKHYSLEFLLFLLASISGYLLAFPNHTIPLTTIFLIFKWWIIDACLLYFILRFSSSSSITLVCIAMIFIGHAFLFTYWWTLLLSIFLFSLYDTLKKE